MRDGGLTEGGMRSIPSEVSGVEMLYLQIVFGIILDGIGCYTDEKSLRKFA